jgi:Leucine-rich repeat (LRR) protein
MRTILNWKRGSVTLALAVLLMIAATATGQASNPAQTGQVVFNDPYLEEIVRNILGKPEGEITPEDMAWISYLAVYDVYDLTGLEWAVNLKYFEMSHTEVTDLSPLSLLGQLNSLRFVDNPDIDWDTLPRLNSVKTLDLEEENFEELYAIARLKRLDFLRIAGCEFEEVSPLLSFNRLIELTLIDCAVTDISALGGVKSLKRLSIHESTVPEINLEEGALPKLEHLDLYRLPLQDVAFIGRLNRLKSLYLYDLSLDSLPDISNLGKLHLVYVGGMPSADLSSLSQLESIKALWVNLDGLNDLGALISPALPSLLLITGEDSLSDLTSLEGVENQIHDLQIWGIDDIPGMNDIAGIENLVSLRRLQIRGTTISDLTPLGSLTQLKKLYLSRNEITDLTPLVENESFSSGLLAIEGNPLSCDAMTVQIPILKARGVRVEFDNFDCVPPYVDQVFPADGATDVPVNSKVTFHIKDDMNGVYKYSLRVTINGVVFYWNSLRITGSKDDYLVEADPPGYFAPGELVEVAVDAFDNHPSLTPMPTFTYSFTTAETHPMVTLNMASPESVYAGENLMVRIRADEVNGLAGGEISIEYPADVLEFILARPRRKFADCSLGALDDPAAGTIDLTLLCDHGSSGIDLILNTLKFKVVDEPESGGAQLGFLDTQLWNDEEPPEIIPSQGGEAIEFSVLPADEAPQ